MPFAIPPLLMAAWPFLKGAYRLFVAPLLNPEIWPALAVAGLAVYGIGYWNGDAHGDRQCESRIERDRDRQDKAIREAGETTMTAIDRWLTETEKSNELEIQLAIEASKDPAADRACISLDGMRRLNRYTRQPRG